jgi:hypothetical protein
MIGLKANEKTKLALVAKGNHLSPNWETWLVLKHDDVRWTREMYRWIHDGMIADLAGIRPWLVVHT